MTDRGGDCWTTNPDGRRVFVHRRGWMIQEECLSDSRFAGDELLAAFDAAFVKMDPGVRSLPRGCLGRLNPDWARELEDFLWDQRTVVSCPPAPPTPEACADTAHLSWTVTHPATRRPLSVPYHLIRLIDPVPCVVSGGSGLPGLIFHETLHAARTPMLPAAEHNAIHAVSQARYVEDLIYAAEATCFFGVVAAARPRVNLLQCLATVRHHADEPLEEWCRSRSFGTSFTGLAPFPGFGRH